MAPAATVRPPTTANCCNDVRRHRPTRTRHVSHVDPARPPRPFYPARSGSRVAGWDYAGATARIPRRPYVNRLGGTPPGCRGNRHLPFIVSRPLGRPRLLLERCDRTRAQFSVIMPPSRRSTDRQPRQSAVCLVRLTGRNDASLSRLCHGQTASCQPASSLSSAREGVPLAERWPDASKNQASASVDRSVSGHRISAGSKIGREAILGLVRALALQLPTCVLGSERGFASVNHIAVPDDRKVLSVERHVASSGGRRLSDHDAYVVEIEDPPRPTATSSGRRDGQPDSLEARE